MKLKKYNEKRNFNSTNEPKGIIDKKNKNRFVVQHHWARKEHFDFRLEFGGVLISFAVPKGLSNELNEKRLAVHVEDHPVDYISFEGEIEKGNYGAGKVEIFDSGFFTPLKPMRAGLKNGIIKFELCGKKLNGVWSLVRTDEPNWLIIKNENQKKSLNKMKLPFNSVDVKLCTLTNSIPKADYGFEIKYDGYRIVAYIGNKVTLKTRNNIDYTEKFNNIATGLKNLNLSAILDGEIVVFDKLGRSNYALLTDSIKNNQTLEFCYVVFDILALNNKDLRNKTLLERKDILKEVLKDAPPNILISDFIKESGQKCFDFAKKHNLEGIVAKKFNSKYNGKRDDDWLKIKCYKRQEFVVGGFSVTEKNKELSAIHVGYFDKGKLIYAGKVGTGFNNSLRSDLNKLFNKNIRKNSPFIDFQDKSSLWITPKFVAEIQFAEFTKNKVLRQPSFVALRKDKDAKDVVLESVKWKMKSTLKSQIQIK